MHQNWWCYLKLTKITLRREQIQLKADNCIKNCLLLFLVCSLRLMPQAILQKHNQIKFIVRIIFRLGSEPLISLILLIENKNWCARLKLGLLENNIRREKFCEKILKFDAGNKKLQWFMPPSLSKCWARCNIFISYV